MRLSIVFILGIFLFSAAFAATNISSCSAPEAVITAGGEYTVNASLSGAPNAGSNGTACILVASDDVLIDCQGFDMTHDGSADTSAILLNLTPNPKNNITIKNCNIRDYDSGIIAHNQGPNPEEATIINSTLSSNRYGIRLPNGKYNLNLTFNTIANNTVSGFQDHTYHADDIYMTGDRFLGNAKDFNYSGTSGIVLSLTDVILGSGGAEYQANISIIHIGLDENATIVWVPSPSVPTANHSYFLNKSFNITPTLLDNNSNIFNITMSWSEAENLDGIEMWLVNESGSFLLADNPSGRSLFSSVGVSNTSNNTVISLYRDLGCPVISSSGYYIQDRNLNGSPNQGSNGTACVLIAVGNVTWDCAGYGIAHDGSADTAAIMVNRSAEDNFGNVTIKNCDLRDYDSGVLVDMATDADLKIILENNTILSNGRGVYYPDGGTDLNLSSNLIANNTLDGLKIGYYHWIDIVMENDRFLGNGKDFNYSGESHLGLSISDIVLGNPDGTQHVNVTVAHYDLDFTNGTMDWAPSPAPPSSSHQVFLNKSFNFTHTRITNYSNYDNYNVTMEWSAAENVSGLEMWLVNDSGYFLLNDTPSGYSLSVSLNLTAANSTVISLYRYDENCPIITTPIIFNQTKNYLGAPHDLGTFDVCVLINSSDVVFDCNGFNITDDSGSLTSVGVLIDGDPASQLTNVTVRNCPAIRRYVSGIFLDYANDSFILNNTVYDSGDGFESSGGSNNAFIGNMAHNSSGRGFLISNSDSNTIAYNNANTSGTDGFFLAIASNNNISGNLASAYNRGFRLDTCSYNLLENNTAFGNQIGFYLSSSPSNNLTRNTAHDNSVWGVRIENSDDVRFVSEHYHGNFLDILVVENIGTPFSYNLTDVVFDNPAGGFQNHTNLSLNDTVEVSSMYLIRWADDPGGQVLYSSFEEKFLEITMATGTPLIDRAVWQWLDSESAPYVEGRFGLWEYGGAWTLLNGTADEPGNTLSVSNLDPSSDYGILEAVNCPLIDTPGAYSQPIDYTGAPHNVSLIFPSEGINGSACVVINVSDVDFDCNGYNITNNGSTPSFGVLAVGAGQNLTNITLRNCPRIDQYSYGVQFRHVDGGSISNNSASLSETAGFHLYQSMDVTVQANIADSGTLDGFGSTDSVLNNYLDNTANSNGEEGFDLYDPRDVLRNNTAVSNGGDGFHLASSEPNTLSANNASGNGGSGFNLDIFGSIVENNSADNNADSGIYFNSLYGRFVNNTLFGNTAGGLIIFAVQYSNFSINVVHDNPIGIGMLISSNNLFSQNQIHSNVDGIQVLLSDDNAFISDNASQNTQHGMYAEGSLRTIIDPSTFCGNGGSGLVLNASNDTSVTDSIFCTNGADGVYLFDSHHSNITNNSAYDNIVSGFHAASSSDNNLSDNIAYDQSTGSGIRMESAAGNHIDRNDVYSNDIGVLVSTGSDPASFEGNLIYDNSQYGLQILTSGLSTMSDTHFYANGVDLLSNAGYPLYADNSIFDEDSGSFLSFTNLSIRDEPGLDMVPPVYTIDWRDNSSVLPLPTDRESFQQRFVDMSVLGGNVVIENTTWHWTDAELAGYVESNLELWKHNGTWNHMTGATLSAGTNSLFISDLASFSVFAILEDVSVPPDDDGGENPPEEELGISVKSVCNGFIVTVRDGGAPVENALVEVFDETLAPIFASTYTNASGQAAYYGACDLDATIEAVKSGKSGSETDFIECGVCAECQTDEDCPDSEQCLLEQCVPINCPNGQVQNHTCVIYECVNDADCTGGQICIGHQCRPAYECISDNDCGLGQFCQIPEGENGGECEDVSCGCGLIENHACTAYGCCQDGDCPENLLCRNNTCVLADIDCPPQGIVGDKKLCNATEGGLPCMGCDFIVTAPDGRNATGRTDDLGRINLPLNLQGDYKVTLLKDGQIIKVVTVQSLPRPGIEDEGKQTAMLPLEVQALFLVILVALLGLALYLLRRRKGDKPGKPIA
ncbi:MAG: right-handed parallel beta-helix repeat-containing protein [Candidatus Micrarchaeota archaeon]